MSSVLDLRPIHNPDDRACAAIRTLADTLEVLGDIYRQDPVALQFFGLEIEQADTTIALLNARVRMKRTTAQLCSKFGRAAP